MIAHDCQIAENTASDHQRLYGNTFQRSGNRQWFIYGNTFQQSDDREWSYVWMIPAIRWSWATKWKLGFTVSMSTKKTVSHSSVHFAKVSLLSKIKSRTSKRLLDGGYNYWYMVCKIWRFAYGFAGFQGTKMHDQLSNRPFSTWLTYSPIFIFLLFPSSDLDLLAKIFIKQETKLIWPKVSFILLI